MKKQCRRIEWKAELTAEQMINVRIFLRAGNKTCPQSLCQKQQLPANNNTKLKKWKMLNSRGLSWRQGSIAPGLSSSLKGWKRYHESIIWKKNTCVRPWSMQNTSSCSTLAFHDSSPPVIGYGWSALGETMSKVKALLQVEKF